jgi:transcriptional regulator of acetoin/glycerol metabolism
MNTTRLCKDVSISQNAMSALTGYNWLGNIRELQNVIERLCVTCDLKINNDLVVHALDECRLEDFETSDRVECVRKNHIVEVLRQCGNNKKKAAEKLGISRTTLWRELKRRELSVK